MSGLSGDAAKSLAADLGSRLAQEVAYVGNASERLARVLPSVKDVVPSLREARSGGRLEWLRPVAWSWDSVDRPGAAGAYRTRDFPRRGYVYTGQKLLACEPRLARWLAVPSNAHHLAYDPVRHVLTVPLGGRLPGLWERAVVLASGRPPQQSHDRHVYRDVPASVAATVATTLAVTTEEIIVA